MADFPDFAAFDTPPSPEETALARAAALKRTRDVEGLRSIGLLGSILGGNAAPMGAAAAMQGKQIEEQGVELSKSDAARRDHALSRAMAMQNAAAMAAERAIDNKRQDHAQQRADEIFAYNKANPTAQVTIDAGGNIFQVPGRMGTNIPAAPVQRPDGGGQMKQNRPVPEAAIQHYNAAVAQADIAGKLAASFKDEYAADPEEMLSGTTADAKLWLARKRGANAPQSGGQYSKDALTWWAKFRKDIEIAERHAMFGGTITSNEKDVFDFARTIHPGSAPAEIRRALYELNEVSRNKPASLKTQLETQGYNPLAPPQTPAQAPAGTPAEGEAVASAPAPAKSKRRARIDDLVRQGVTSEKDILGYLKAEGL